MRNIDKEIYQFLRQRKMSMLELMDSLNADGRSLRLGQLIPPLNRLEKLGYVAPEDGEVVPESGG